MGSGAVRLEGASVWEVGDDTARWLGEVPAPEGMVMADLTIDCAPREVALRGLTGRVSDNFGEIAVDAALSCGTWGSPKVELSTEEATRPCVQAFYNVVHLVNRLETETRGGKQVRLAIK
jgi:hypothetical protein